MTRRISRRSQIDWFDVIDNLTRMQQHYFAQILGESNFKKEWFIFQPDDHRNTARKYLHQLKKLKLINRKTNGHGNKKYLRVNPLFIRFFSEEGNAQKVVKRISIRTKNVHTPRKTAKRSYIYYILNTVIIYNNYVLVKLKNGNNMVAKRIAKKRALKKLQNKKPKTRTLKRRIDPDIQEVIDHWNSYNFPFAKVVKSTPLIKPIKQAFRNRTVPKKYQVDEIKKLIDKAHSYMTSPLFKFHFTTKYKLRLLNFFVAEPRSIMGKFLFQNNISSWRELFQKKGDTWIEINLLNLPKLRKTLNDIEPEEALRDMQNIFSWFDGDDHDTKATMIVLANKAMKMAKDHALSYETVRVRLREYIKYEDVSKQELHWYASDRFWNHTLRQHIKRVLGI